MLNKPTDLSFGSNLFTIEKITEEKTITINIVINAKAQVKLGKFEIYYQ